MKVQRWNLELVVLLLLSLRPSVGHAAEMPKKRAAFFLDSSLIYPTVSKLTNNMGLCGHNTDQIILTDNHEWWYFMERLKAGLRFRPHRQVTLGFGRDVVLWADHLPKWRYGGTIVVDTTDFTLRGFVDLDRRAIGARLWPGWYDVTAMMAIGHGRNIGLQANSNIGAGAMSEFRLGHSNCHIYILATVLDTDTLMSGRLHWNYPRLGAGLSWSY